MNMIGITKFKNKMAENVFKKITYDVRLWNTMKTIQLITTKQISTHSSPGWVG